MKHPLYCDEKTPSKNATKLVSAQRPVKNLKTSPITRHVISRDHPRDHPRDHITT